MHDAKIDSTVIPEINYLSVLAEANRFKFFVRARKLLECDLFQKRFQDHTVDLQINNITSSHKQSNESQTQIVKYSKLQSAQYLSMY